MTLKTAVFLYEITQDLLVLDAIRVISTPKSTQFATKNAENYVRTQYAAYLTLFRNSGKYPHHERPTDSPSDCAD